MPRRRSKTIPEAPAAPSRACRRHRGAAAAHAMLPAPHPSWPPLGLAARYPRGASAMCRRCDDTLHWLLGDIVPPSLAEAMRDEGQEASHERLRLLYVACTRAMELLVLPELSWTDDAAWMRALDFKLEEVPEL